MVLDRIKEVYAFDAFSQVSMQNGSGGRGQAGSDGLLEGGQAMGFVAKVIADDGLLIRLVGGGEHEGVINLADAGWPGLALPVRLHDAEVLAAPLALLLLELRPVGIGDDLAPAPNSG